MFSVWNWCINMYAEIAQIRADLTHSKFAGEGAPDPPSTPFLTVRNFKIAQTTPLCRMHMYNHSWYHWSISGRIAVPDQAITR